MAGGRGRVWRFKTIHWVFALGLYIGAVLLMLVHEYHIQVFGVGLLCGVAVVSGTLPKCPGWSDLVPVISGAGVSLTIGIVVGGSSLAVGLFLAGVILAIGVFDLVAESLWD